jgi:hypothetical protein
VKVGRGISLLKGPNVNDQVNSPPPGPQLFPTFAMRGVKC